jgi:hypothetical protein
MLVYFMTICYILWPFGIIYVRLVLFVVICYIFPVLVCLDQEKSGNPDHKQFAQSREVHSCVPFPRRRFFSLEFSSQKNVFVFVFVSAFFPAKTVF